MIEIPRACVVADEIAKEAEFFSFGTNDLTQTALGMSRDDSGLFLPAYQALEIIKQNPFATIDTDRRRWADEDGHRAGTQDAPGHQARHLRRTRRRSRFREILPRDRPDLRELLAVPRAHRAIGGSAGGIGRRLLTI